MPIDPSKVKWDDAPAIDPSQVQWDDAPKPKAPAVSRMEKLVMGITDPIHGGAQLLTHVLPQGVVDAGNKLNNWIADNTGLVAKVPERNLTSLVTGQPTGVDALVAKREADYQAKRAAAGETGFDGWRMVGGIAPSLAIPAVNATSLPARAILGATTGAANNAMAPVTDGDFAKQKKAQIMTGAAFGAAAPLLAAGVARVISPKASVNPDLAKLRSEGVTPTVGQALGGRWNALEEKAQSLPIAGDMIANARQRGLESFNRAAINRATSPVGGKAASIGQDGVAEAGDIISSAYDKGKSALGHFQIDNQGAQELTTLKQMVAALPDKERKVFEQHWQLLASEVSPNGSIVADGFKRLDSKLGKESARFSGSPDAYQQQLGDALAEMKRIITENAKRANPDAASQIKAADAAYANLVRVEGAAKSAKNSGGVFTPAQLNSAVQQADRTVRKRATARGEALLQDLAAAGQNVIGNKVPNSFTTDRMLIAGGGLGAGLVNPAIPASLLGTGLLYTAPVQGLLTRAVASRPDSAKAVADALRKASPGLGLLGGQLGLQLGL